MEGKLKLDQKRESFESFLQNDSGYKDIMDCFNKDFLRPVLLVIHYAIESVPKDFSKEFITKVEIMKEVLDKEKINEQGGPQGKYSSEFKSFVKTLIDEYMKAVWDYKKRNIKN